MIVLYKMQKWLKFQSQNRMTKEKIIPLLVITIILLIPPQIFAQEDGEESTFDASKAVSMFQHHSIEYRNELIKDMIEIPIEEHEKIILNVGDKSGVTITHVIKDGKWLSDQPRKIKILPGIHSNLDVTDPDDDLYPFYWENETFEDSEYIVLQSKLGGHPLLVSYDLEKYFEKENNKWKKMIEYPFDVEMIFDEEIDKMYANSRGIDLSDANGIKCVGCKMLVEFFSKNSFETQQILTEDNSFEIKVWSDGKTSGFEFNDSIRELYFKTEKNDQLVSLEIPTELMLYPFEAYLTMNDDTILDQLDKIRHTEFDYSDESVKITIKPANTGNISLIGSTETEHEKLFTKLEEERKAAEMEQPVLQKEKNDEEKESQSRTDIYESWGGGSENDNTEDYTMIYAIIGIIAAIIIGVIIKVKKN